MGVGQVLTMPLFFASNAIYPSDIMPGWLKTISHLNPLTYVVDALRTFMLAGSASTFGLSRDYAVIVLTTTWKNSGRLGEIVLFMGIVINYDPKERAKILQETL